MKLSAAIVQAAIITGPTRIMAAITAWRLASAGLSGGTDTPGWLKRSNSS